MNAPIPDGSYDAFVVDARVYDARSVMTLTLTTGERKGAIVDVATSDTLDEVAIIGMPCTLVVERGTPRVAW